MEEIKYIGETLWIGSLGGFAIVIGFVAALFSGLSYFIATRNRDGLKYESWKKLGRIGYIIHGISILILMGLIFYAMYNHMYEYKYIFEHVSDDLPMKYILSAFWEGQEGSFMLWMFWHIILGFVLIKKKVKLEAPVMMVIAFVEVWINTMLLGTHFTFGEEIYKIGSNPIILIRQVTEAPIFSNANYLELISGKGLNPLLQNYWMTIHPPTTFLGFASTVVPFAFAIGGLMYREDKSWLIDVQRWALFSAAILGIGIFMGSLWAYEALSFGGYWAWDPVENTSLVPWIILIAGVHTNMIARNTGYSIKITYFAYLLSFILIVYSTTLTRSGILGDTSAHAFTEMGLEWQLLGFILFFIAMALYYFFKRFKTIPSKPKEESIYSREFWMFIGSLVLFFSGFLIDFSSSLPVYNTIVKVFDPNYVGKVIQDPIDHYNKYQLWIGVLVGLLSGVTIFFRYKDVEWGKDKIKQIFTRIGVHLLIAGAFTYLFSLWIALPSWQYVLLSFTSLFAIAANADYLISIARKSWGLVSAGLSHIGFGVMLLGVLASGLNSYYLNNTYIFKGVFGEGDDEKYIQLIKQKPLLVRGHLVTYESDTLIDRTRFYDIKFQKIDKDLNVLDSFKTRPNAVYSNDYSKIAAFNPDTRHYIDRDVFTCIVSLPPAVRDVQEAKAIEDSLQFKSYDLAIGDSIKFEVGTFVLDNINYDPKHPEYDTKINDFGVELEFRILENNGTIVHKGITASGLSGNLLYKYPNKSEDFKMIIRPTDKVFDNLLTPEYDLDYQDFNLKIGETIDFNDSKLTLTGFDRNLDSTKYNIKTGDISIAAVINIKKGNENYTMKPVYIIRGSAPMGVKDFSPETQIHARLSNIDPRKEEFEIKLAINKSISNTIPIEIAENVPRSDYIILEAKVFPGINFFWAGGILMMVGLIVAWFARKQKNANLS